MWRFYIFLQSIVPSEPATQSPDRVIVLYPSDKQTCDHQIGQIGPFHTVRLLAHVNDVIMFLMLTYNYARPTNMLLLTRGN